MKRLQMLAREEGAVWVDIIDHHEASDIASHWNAVWRYLKTRDRSALWRQEGAGVGLYEFETDPHEIDFWVLLTAIQSVAGE